MSDSQRQNFLEEQGNLVRMARLDTGMTQEELGIEVGYSANTAKQAISQIERGTVGIPSKKLNALVSTLNLDAGRIQLANYHYSVGQFGEGLRILSELLAYYTAQKTTRLENVGGEMREPSGPGINSSELKEKLEKLKSLFEVGLIDEEDYKMAKQEALKSFINE